MSVSWGDNGGGERWLIIPLLFVAFLVWFFKSSWLDSKVKAFISKMGGQ